jgi:predicted kinase
LSEGLTLWFTGLAGAGKSTIARLVEGHLLERRFRAVVVETDEQLFTTFRYVARNPVDVHAAPSPQAASSVRSTSWPSNPATASRVRASIWASGSRKAGDVIP